MASQAQLLPSLFALLPSDQLDLILSRLSLHALAVEPWQIRDDVFLATHPVLPGQNRTLRLRARRRRARERARERAAEDARAGMAEGSGSGSALGSGLGSGTASGTAAVPEGGPGSDDSWDYALAWVSPPLSGREYAEMRVQAYVGLEVAGMSGREEIEDFVEGIGFKHSHTISRLGHLFHLPIPGSVAHTLHLTVTRVLAPQDNPADLVGEPYLVHLQPGRPVSAVAQNAREIVLVDMMRVMQDVANRIDGLEWETGR